MAAHGYLQVTRAVGLVIQLTPENISKAFAALAAIDYHPAVPVTAAEFADPALREKWRTEKNMFVLKLWSDRHRETPIDIFIYHPFDFEREYQRALVSADPNSPRTRLYRSPLSSPRNWKPRPTVTLSRLPNCETSRNLIPNDSEGQRPLRHGLGSVHL